MTTQVSTRPSFITKVPAMPRANLLWQIVLVTRRNLVTIARTPAALLPPLAISIFFLIIYESTLGKAANFIPNLSGNSYLGFILPLSIVSSSLSGAGIAAQNMVRDIESGYFDKLLLTPVSRAALLLGPILAGALILGIQATIVILVAMVMGLESASGIGGLLVVIGLAVLLGTGFAGFTVSAALGSGSAAATQGASFIFFPLTFLTASFVPLELLSGWLETAARFNPITYVLEAMRTVLLTGWDGAVVWQGVLACLLLGGAMYALAVRALHVRTSRK
ncbi:MAG: ABC transporter permease [Chloroflexota bacterium]|nr:ABC transporter permease [Anaerolineales bacterium]MCA9974284.1 ABC transporter permease [Anaerolineales bacterium]MCB8965863.1 ABC transporter permease [Ardenticatenaceae bacterium]